ncbi:MAG: hypothetical protein EZS28_016130 [Streblomastix strix]|uniref:Reverse transcriptase domain-containing protein n=1 Tax=Streblomastix strix TaxID=222440 RepID=A0A5J4W069_9EUKA|nr:MAG: hypothetical protein EZS28_016130 [Streblomastix strix]
MQCINWENVSVPERHTYRIQEWNKINDGIDIQTGALPKLTSVEALQQLETIQKYKDYHAPLLQLMEYARQLEKEIKEGIVLQTDQIKLIYPTFLVPKPGNKWRKILYCKQVNVITNLIKFKMESSEFIKQILEKQVFATTVDLKNAFHHIKVSSDLLPYFGFAFQGRLFTQSGLPFGYKNNPYLFNKVLSIAIRSIRQKWNIKINNYIDDIVLLHQDKDYLKRTTQEIIAFLQNLGFKIQFKKCHLYPSRVFNYQGQVWNSNSLEVMMTPQRRRIMKIELKRWISATDNGEMVKVRDLAKLLGELNFLKFQMQDASLISKSLSHLKTQAMKKGGWNCSVLLNRRVLGNLQLRFIKIKQNKPRKLEDLTTQALLTTDAALEDWCPTLQIQQTKKMEAG